MVYSERARREAFAVECDGVEQILWLLIKGALTCYVFTGTEEARGFLREGLRWYHSDIVALSADDGVKRCYNVLKLLENLLE